MCNTKTQEEYKAITPVIAYQIMDNNKELKNLVHNRKVLYAEGYFVIADGRYVFLDGDGYHLTQAAKNNMADSIIGIVEEKQKRYPDRYFNYVFYGLPNNQFIKAYKIDEDGKNNIIQLLREDNPIVDGNNETLRYFDVKAEKELVSMIGNPNITLCDCLIKLFKWRAWNTSIYVENTLLNRNYYSKILNNKYNDMGVKVLLALCVGLRLNKGLTEKMFTKSKYNLDPYKPQHSAYLHILENTPYLSIEEFNDILTEWGYAPLGSAFREKNK